MTEEQAAKKRKRPVSVGPKSKKSKPPQATNNNSKPSIVYNGVQMPFPKPSQNASNGDQLYCICRSIDNGELMVGCDNCDDWYHFDCLKLDRKMEKLYYKFYCPYCESIDPEKFQSVFRKKCLLPSCGLPIVMNSKFCTKDHGLKYYKQIKEKLTELPPKDLRHLKLGEISKILKSPGNLDFEKFSKLGDSLPESTESEFGKFVNIDDPVSEYNVQLKNINQHSEHLQQQQKFYHFKSKYLGQVKNQLKQINDYFLEISGAALSQAKTKPKDKGKKNASKKFEICGYNKLLALTLAQWQKYLKTEEAHRIFSSNNDENIDFETIEIVPEFSASQLEKLKTAFVDIEAMKEYQDSLTNGSPQEIFPETCLLEKKKCGRHGGWLSRVNDEIVIRTNEITAEENEWKSQLDGLKHRYVVEYWECNENSKS
ncbi:Spp1 protein [Saccharomycopsis crataegensis]|uniref:Spp1 protein n=1 Tax=Saccharomycopsis crataegensis TaxID=43959 RepID=A0AAV5QNL0_9ASCO|nr:Spp1 protein [Saccharomycopsis crataegensis]